MDVFSSLYDTKQPLPYNKMLAGHRQVFYRARLGWIKVLGLSNRRKAFALRHSHIIESHQGMHLVSLSVCLSVSPSLSTLPACRIPTQLCVQPLSLPHQSPCEAGQLPPSRGPSARIPKVGPVDDGEGTLGPGTL